MTAHHVRCHRQSVAMMDRVRRRSSFDLVYVRVESDSVWCHVNKCKEACYDIVASQKYRDRFAAVDKCGFQAARTGYSAVAEICADQNQQQWSNRTAVEVYFQPR